MKSYSPFVLALLIASACGAQVAAPKLKSSDLRVDAAILRTAYEQLHPGLYRYDTKAQMDGDFDTLSRQLDHDQTLEEAFIAFSQFAAKVRCGHTQANPFNQTKAVVEALFQSSTRLPFYFDWLGGRMIVTRDFTPDHTLPAGTEVERINGVETSAILNKLLPITRADGTNEGKRMAQLAVNGDSLYESFDLYYPMLFPPKNAKYILLVRRPGGSHTQKMTVRPLTFEERVAPIKQREEQRKGGDEALFEWKYLPDGNAYLKMPTWALYDSKWNWKRWLEEHIDAVERKAPALILDLRGNEGGDDVGNEIIPHLIDAPIHLSAMSRLVRYRKVPESLIPYLDTWDKSFLDWGSAAVDLREPWPTAPAQVTYLKLSRYDDNGGGDVLKPATKRFRGKVVVLIDSTNSSATFQFAQNIQNHHLGTLIGRPTGGSQRGINGGAFFFLRLPHSNIEMDLPLIATFPAVSMPDAGVTPDVVVEVTPSDNASGYDATLAAATLAIQGGNSKH